MLRLTSLARLGLALCLPIWSSGCATLLGRPKADPERVLVVCAPAAMAPCTESTWLIPSGMSADQAGELALSERAEKQACAAKQRESVKCITDHNDKAGAE